MHLIRIRLATMGYDNIQLSLWHIGANYKKGIVLFHNLSKVSLLLIIMNMFC